MIKTAKEKNLFFMEAMWTAFNPCVNKIKEIISQGKIGKLKHIESRFCIGEENIFSGFIATSFSEKKARNFSRSISNSGYLIKIRAKKYTKGIAINGNEVGMYRGQKEWLLNENQKYITLNIDEKNRIIEIKLL
ncbi:MAG: ADP-ribosyltransferase, partial [Methanobrevibacter sp.]|nr:ADP-ribosyltransferase [Methanobrevibacter sp.]